MSEPGEMTAPALPKHEFLAGRIALDFCNSLSGGPHEGAVERIGTPRHFAEWARRRDLVLEHVPNTSVLHRLHRLRRALYEMVDALSEGRAPAGADLKLFNAELAEARAAEQLVATSSGYEMADLSSSSLDRIRYLIVRDAADLLTGDSRRVKHCANHDCRWLFYDVSKNFSRRWCAMDDCGTKDKVRRFRQRAG